MSSKANAGEGFEHACEQALEACARGLPLRHLRSCAIVTDVGRMHLTACERLPAVCARCRTDGN